LYEASGPDFDYTLRVHQIMITSAWHLLRGSDYQDDIVGEYTKMYDWQSYNLVRQPDGAGYLTNKGLTTRTNKLFYTTLADPMGEFMPNARFLSSTAAEDAAANASLRSTLASSWGNWGALPVNQSASYPPGPFQDADRVGWRPTEQQRTDSTNALPYLSSSRFVQQFVDTRRAAQFTFIRRPSYYVSLNTGQNISSLQRYGLGLIWNPTFGAVMQDQSASDVSSWGTKASAATKVYEASTINTAFKINGQPVTVAAGAKRLADGTFSASYALGSAGTKTITFNESSVTFAITHTGVFTETIPLLKKSGETINVSPGQISITRGDVTFLITFPTSVTVTRNTPGVLPGDDLAVENFVLSGSGSLSYTMSFAASPLVINGDRTMANFNDTFRLVQSGTLAQVFFNDGAAPEAQWDLALAPSSVTLNGLGGDDTFIIDLTAGNPMPATGLSFSGGTGSGNGVVLIGGTSGIAAVASASQLSISPGAASYSNTQLLTLNLGASADTLTYTGTGPAGGLKVHALAGGTLSLGSGTAFPASTAVTASGTLNLNGVGTTLGTLSGSGVVTNLKANSPAALTLGGSAAGDFTFAGSIRDGATTQSVTKTGGGTMTLSGSNTFTGPFTAFSGTAILQSPLITPASVLVQTSAMLRLAVGSGAVLKTAALTVNGTLDVADNAMILPNASIGSWNGSTYTGVTGLIQKGRNGGAWNGGSGILTSMPQAKTASPLTTLGVANVASAGAFRGVSIAAGDVLVMYTYIGDANLDGKVNVDDYVRIDQGVSSGTSGWFNGDFNFDGKVNVDDYVMIDGVLSAQGPPFPTT
jgi:autotransporter-associated beta strand protein